MRRSGRWATTRRHPYREAAVMSLTTILGAQGNFFDELAPRPPRLVLRSPILDVRSLAQLRAAPALKPATISLLVSREGSEVEAFDARLRAIADEARGAVDNGSALVILSDRGIDADHPAVPAVLATAAVHHALIACGLR